MTPLLTLWIGPIFSLNWSLDITSAVTISEIRNTEIYSFSIAICTGGQFYPPPIHINSLLKIDISLMLLQSNLNIISINMLGESWPKVTI